MERELSNSSFFIICTSKVGTSKCHFCFAAEKAVKSRRSSTNFNCKVSSVDGLSFFFEGSSCRWAFFKYFCGLESGRVKPKEIKH